MCCVRVEFGATLMITSVFILPFYLSPLLLLQNKWNTACEWTKTYGALMSRQQYLQPIQKKLEGSGDSESEYWGESGLNPTGHTTAPYFYEWDLAKNWLGPLFQWVRHKKRTQHRLCQHSLHAFCIAAEFMKLALFMWGNFPSAAKHFSLYRRKAILKTNAKQSYFMLAIEYTRFTSDIMQYVW